MDMNERRCDQRFRATVYLKIDNHDTGNELGYLLDLSEQGLQVAVQEPIEIGSTWQLLVKLDSAVNESTQFEVAVQNRWCRRSRTQDCFSCGMKFKTISRDDAMIVAQLIQRSSFEAVSG